MRGVGRDSSFGTGTPYRLHGPGIKSRYWASSFALVRTGSGSHWTSYTMSTVSFSGMHLARYGGNHSRHEARRLKESRTILLLALVVISRMNFTFQEVYVNYGLLKLFVLIIYMIRTFLQYRFLISQFRNSKLNSNYAVGMWKTLIYLYTSKNSQSNSNVLFW
jgi:hypothetical protein